METLLAERIFGVPFVALAAIALAVAVIFAVVEINTAGSDGIRWLILRWFHSLCWVLLTIAAVLRGKLVPGGEAFAAPAAVGAGVVYAVYLVTMVAGRA